MGVERPACLSLSWVEAGRAPSRSEEWLFSQAEGVLLQPALKWSQQSPAGIEVWIGKGPRSYPSLTREGEQACLDLDLLLTNQVFQEGLCVCAQEKMVRQWLEEVHRDLLCSGEGRGGKGRG